MTTTAHPGRLAALERAATADIKAPEREALIKLGARGWDTEHVLRTLRRVVELRAAGWHDDEADRLIRSLLEPPPEGHA